MNGWERTLYRRLPAAQLAMRAGHLLGARDVRGRVPQPAHAQARHADGAAPARAAGPGPGAAREAARRATRSAASASCRPTSGIRRSAAERRAGRPTAIREVRPRSIVAADGTEREVDTIIFGTGFHVTDIPIARPRARARRALAGRGLGRHARAPTRARPSPGSRTCSCSSGPNTGLGHNSIVFMIESQLNYVAGALRRDAPARRRHVDVRPEAQAAYNAELDELTRGHRVGQRRLRELLHRPQRPQLDDLADVHVAVPAAHARVRRGRLRGRRARRARAGARGQRRSRAARSRAAAGGPAPPRRACRASRGCARPSPCTKAGSRYQLPLFHSRVPARRASTRPSRRRAAARAGGCGRTPRARRPAPSVVRHARPSPAAPRGAAPPPLSVAAERADPEAVERRDRGRGSRRGRAAAGRALPVAG